MAKLSNISRGDAAGVLLFWKGVQPEMKAETAALNGAAALRHRLTNV
jgi:hypothetical protein